MTTFTTGKTYATRSFCDHDCVFSFEVVKRSTKTVTVKYHGRETRRTVYLSDGVETIRPHGSYSMSPILKATDLVAA